MHRRIRVGSFYRTKGKMQVQMLRTVLAQCFMQKELSHTCVSQSIPAVLPSIEMMVPI